MFSVGLYIPCLNIKPKYGRRLQAEFVEKLKYKSDIAGSMFFERIVSRSDNESDVFSVIRIVQNDIIKVHNSHLLLKITSDDRKDFKYVGMTGFYVGNGK